MDKDNFFNQLQFTTWRHDDVTDLMQSLCLLFGFLGVHLLAQLVLFLLFQLLCLHSLAILKHTNKHRHPSNARTPLTHKTYKYIHTKKKKITK